MSRPGSRRLPRTGTARMSATCRAIRSPNPKNAYDCEVRLASTFEFTAQYTARTQRGHITVGPSHNCALGRPVLNRSTLPPASYHRATLPVEVSVADDAIALLERQAEE